MTTLHSLLEKIEGAEFDVECAYMFAHNELMLDQVPRFEGGMSECEIVVKGSTFQHAKDQKIIKVLCEAIKELSVQRNQAIHLNYIGDRSNNRRDENIRFKNGYIVAILEKALGEDG